VLKDDVTGYFLFAQLRRGDFKEFIIKFGESERLLGDRLSLRLLCWGLLTALSACLMALSRSFLEFLGFLKLDLKPFPDII